MAVISEYEEEKSQNFSTTGANAEELVGPYDEVLGKILQEQSPLALMEILIDFLRRKSDLFRDDSVENRIADMVSSAKRKDAEEKKGKACVQQKAEKRLKQDEPSASTAATYSASREAVKAPKTSDDEDSGLKPNLVTYNTMLDAIGKAGRPSMAKVLNKEMIDEGLTPPSQIGTESLASRLKEQNLLRTQGLIGGKWVSAQDGKTLPVYNPATQELLANVPCMGENETKDAIASAYDAFYSWSKLTATERSKILRKWYELLIAHKEDLGLLMTLENGKPLKEGLGEVVYGASFVEFYAEEAKRIYGDIIPATLSDRRLLVLKQPVGVVGAITPWNFPLAMITRKVAPALASGCTVVVKPSELTPLTALAAAELALQAGVPPGVFNVVMGNASQIGDTLLASSQVRKITFTGSTAVGKKLMSGAAGTVKKVSLELGGNAPCIIFDDAKLEVAVKGTVAAKFRNTGQTCVCVNRVLVQDGIYEKFAKLFASAVQDMQVGNGLEEGVVQGPLITTAALQKVERHVQDAISKGAKVLSGGKRHRLGHTFYEPTVLGDASSDMLISREEVFGPVAPLFRFKTEEEAVKIANDTQFGLASYVFTESMSRIWRVAEALEYGLVGVNEGVISTEVAPFGGFKESGLGREGSKYGIDEYLEVKYVCLGNINH